MHLRIICVYFASENKKKTMEGIEKIKNAGLKLTPQRIAVYNVMEKLKHAQLETIVFHLKSQDTTLTLSTVYRILESFCNAGVLSQVCHPETGESYYDITVEEHHHIFKGENILDFDDKELTQIVKDYVKTKRPDLHDIEKIQVQITIN